MDFNADLALVLFTGITDCIRMDLTIFDITDLPDGAVRAGDYVELFGPSMPLDDVARAAGTIGYEMLTGLGLRYERMYLESDPE